MAAVLPYTSPSTMTMLQTRPSSEAFQNGSYAQQHQRNPQSPRTVYSTQGGGMASGTYRGQQTVPMQHYPFTNPPAAQNRQNPLGQHPTAMAHPRLGDRTSSAPSVPILQQLPQNTAISNRPRPPIINPATNSSSQSAMFKDDTSLSTASTRQSNPRSLQPSDLNSPALQTASYASVAKSAPDRYRRNHRRAETSGVSPTTSNLTQGGSAIPSGSGMATVGHLYTHPTQTSSTPMVSTYPSYRDTQPQAAQGANNFDPQPRLASKDDLNVQHQSSSELAKRYRRRSISSIDAKDYAMQLPEGPTQQSLQRKTYAATLAGPPPERKEVQHVPSFERPSSAHGRNESSESSSSVRSSSRPSSKRGHEISSATSTVQQATPVAKNEAKIVNVPPRGSSDATKRLTNPSPLSKPMPSSPEMPHSKHSFAAQVSQPSAPQATTTPVAIPESPAAQHLAALNKKDGKKEGKSSRLRRAFSFGSAAELRKASAENSASNNTSNERAKLRKDRYQDEQEAQQAAIAQKQEAAGLGEGIYSGQGQFFTGSTDNLSISSTASSASVMIRKMGKGVKKGSRSLVGLFRPKSVVGVPAADSAVPEPSMAQVSMVTVEAEREKVNVNANPHDQVGGGTGFPKLERNSMDAASLAQEPGSVISDRDSARPRPSIVGGERERAEVLAAVKKGILKRTDSGNSSPGIRPVDTKTPDFQLPQLPPFNESPPSSAPSTPVDDHNARSGHRRTDSVNIEGEEYFLNLQNFANGQSKSLPGTPRSIAARNISFSPRIQFHDTWPSGEYDRRGEIATCNRLTPLLAQQIKEELNTFKMEMEVHAESKVYTHFF